MTRPIGLDVRRAAVEAYERGEAGAEQVARRFGVGSASVKRWVARCRSGEGLQPRPHGGGNPPVLRPRERRLLVRLLEERPQATLAEVLPEVQRRLGKAPSVPTARRYLRALHFRRRRPYVTPAAGAERRTRATHYRALHRRAAPAGSYPTDLTDAEWLVVKPLFVRPGRVGRPSVYGERQLLNAIFYALRSGCPWRLLPHDLPPWPTVYAAFRRWGANGLLEEAHHALRRQWRARVGRAPEPTGAVVDSQSAKTTEKGGPAATTAPKR